MNEDENTLERRLRNVELAVFGDGNGSVGMKEQTNDIHEWVIAFKKGGFILKLMGGFIIFVGAVFYGWQQITTFIKSIFLK